jgi:hypothetical protein
MAIEADTVDNKNIIEISGLNELIQFSQYKALDHTKFLSGLLLARNLVNQHDSILIPKDTVIQPKHIEQLKRLSSADSSLYFNFEIQCSNSLLPRLRDDIKTKFVSMYNKLQKTTLYKKFLKNVDDDFEDIVDKLLSDELYAVFIYQQCFVTNSAEKNRATQFIEHPIYVSIIALGIATSEIMLPLMKGNKDLLIDICKAAQFHNYGALKNIDTVLNDHEAEKEKNYWTLNKELLNSNVTSALTKNVQEALGMVYEFQSGRIDFVERSDEIATIANIVLTSEHLINNEIGLFNAKMTPRKIVDKLNVRAIEKRVNSTVVKALTLGLNLLDIFDFYKELNHLINQCPKKCAVSYPLEGFMSPTMVICRNNMVGCPHIEGSLIAVNLVQDFGDLEMGKYRRCIGLSKPLMEYYKSYYRRIKMAADDPDEDE